MQVQCVEDADGTLFLPARRLFQGTESLEEFEAEVWREVAQTLISHEDTFGRAGLRAPSTGALNAWLNNAQYRTAGGGVGGVINANYGSSPNTADGYKMSGFSTAVREELELLFPSHTHGGVICVLDNLELLQSSAQARSVLEALRDRLFNVPQLRWILCGSRGIVSRARSSRRSGFFEAPMHLGALSREGSVDLVRRRLDLYGEDGRAQAPVSPDAFEYLYRALNSNLRDSLAYAQEFSGWLHEEYLAQGIALPSATDRTQLLEAWLGDASDRAVADARGVQPRVWQFFDALARAGGTCRSSDWAQYDFTTQQQLSSSVTALDSVNLVIRETDPENASRSLTSITPLGWLVHFQRNRYELPLSTLSVEPDSST